MQSEESLEKGNKKFKRKSKVKAGATIIDANADLGNDFFDEFVQFARSQGDDDFIVPSSVTDPLLQVSKFIPLEKEFAEVIGAEGIPCGLITEVFGAPDSGKCLAKDTPIIMYDGTRRLVQDIVAGDVLMGVDSKPRTVLSTCTGREMMYEITPNYGDKWRCNESHILSLVNSETGVVSNIAVKDYLNLTDYQKHHLKLYKSGCVEWPVSEDVKYDPYWVGLWLGDGSIGEAIITKERQELEPYFEEFASKNDLFYKKRVHSNRCSGHAFVFSKGQPNHLRAFCQTLVVDDEKRIPFSYLISSVENRKRLLAGLLDSDGYANVAGYEIMTKYRGLCDDILFLARSLGFRATFSEEIIRQFNPEGEVYWRLYISGNGLHELPVLLKPVSERRDKRNHLRSGFEIECVGDGEYFGFTLDGDDGLFLLGDFTVTHNTTFVTNIIKRCQEAGGIAVLILSEHKYDLQRAADMGVDVSKLIIRRPKTIEDVREHIHQVCTLVAKSKTIGDRPVAMVWDSLAATPCRKELDESRGEFAADQAAALTGLLRKTQGMIRDHNIAFVMINQISQKIGITFGKKTQSKGGFSPKFYSALRMEFTQIGRLRAKGDDKGADFSAIRSEIEVVKNHLGTPFKTLEVAIDYKGFVFNRDVEKRRDGNDDDKLSKKKKTRTDE